MELFDVGFVDGFRLGLLGHFLGNSGLFERHGSASST
jgi:hypothetical protein